MVDAPPAPPRVQKYRGCLALRVDASTARAIAAQIHEYERSSGAPLVGRTDSDEWHVTVATKSEVRWLDEATIAEALALPTRYFTVGLGGYAFMGVYFVACVWPKAQAWRLKHGLPPQDFHVTVSDANSHTVDKTFTEVFDKAASLARLDMQALEALARQLVLANKYTEAFTVACHACTRFDTATWRAWVRLGDAALGKRKHKTAMLSYARAIANGADEDVVTYCLDRLPEAARVTEWGLLFRESELDELPTELRASLLQAWSPRVLRRIQDGVRSRSTLDLPSRERLFALSCATSPTVSETSTPTTLFYRMPRFFRWVVPFVLAGMSTPKNADDVLHLACSVGIRHIVTLTEETPLPSEWFTPLPTIRNTFLPIANCRAPSMEQVDVFISICLAESESEPAGSVLVHCGGGKGRAGTMLACYLVAFGFGAPIAADEWQLPAMSAAAAIQAVRQIRPGSVETDEQGAAVTAYSTLLWNRRSVVPKSVPEPLASKPLVEGKPVASTDLLVLCGVPGSGKSSFRSALLKRTAATSERSTPQWTVLSGDEIGRDACERGISNHGIRRAILDRCNGLQQDRCAFLSMASTWSKHATAVWFDLPSELCIARAQRRADHPTLPAGSRVRAAVTQHGRSFVPPTLSEGFQTIVRVTSIEAAQELVTQLTPALKLLRFPRTPHLINLGAATEDDLVLGYDGNSSNSSDEASERVPTVCRDPNATIVITEKLDGANMGIALDAAGHAFVVQNRSHYVCATSHVQFRKLGHFLEQHGAALRALLLRDSLFPERFILYGEWLAATHSIPYSNLESYFYAFDLFDRVRACFLGRRQLEQLLQTTSLPLVPELWSCPHQPSRAELVTMVQQPSKFYDGRVEGVLVKWEVDGVVKERAKVVRKDFIAGNEHWTRGSIQFNQVRASLPVWDA